MYTNFYVILLQLIFCLHHGSLNPTRSHQLSDLVLQTVTLSWNQPLAPLPWNSLAKFFSHKKNLVLAGLNPARLKYYLAKSDFGRTQKFGCHASLRNFFPKRSERTKEHQDSAPDSLPNDLYVPISHEILKPTVRQNYSMQHLEMNIQSYCMSWWQHDSVEFAVIRETLTEVSK